MAYDECSLFMNLKNPLEVSGKEALATIIPDVLKNLMFYGAWVGIVLLLAPYIRWLAIVLAIGYGFIAGLSCIWNAIHSGLGLLMVYKKGTDSLLWNVAAVFRIIEAAVMVYMGVVLYVRLFT